MNTITPISRSITRSNLTLIQSIARHETHPGWGRAQPLTPLKVPITQV
jgi:hypothetical protein